MPNVECLKQLRRVVLAAPDDRFHMNQFCDDDARCGTAYCAAGWAAVDPWFRENTTIGELFAVGPDGVLLFPTPFAKVWPGLEAIFGLGSADADNLFAGTAADYMLDPHEIGKDAVLDNIDRLLAGEPARPYLECRDEDEDDDLDLDDDFDLDDDLEFDDEDDEE